MKKIGVYDYPRRHVFTEILIKSFDKLHHKGGLWTDERQLVDSVRGELVEP
jgi:hypothetical protein